MKRSIHWILIITLLVSLFPVPTFATDNTLAETTESPPDSSAESEPSPTKEEQSSGEEPQAPYAEEPKKEQPLPSRSSPSRVSGLIPEQRAVAETPAGEHHEGVVITQLQTRGTSASEELVELYNNSDQAVDVTDWCLRRASASGSSYTTMVCLKAETEGKESRVILPARSYIFAVSSTSLYEGFDLQFTSGLSDSGGRVGLFNQRGERQDLVAWGSATIEAETAPVSILPAPGSLLQRKSLGVGSYQDTDNNAVDFENTAPRASYDYGALVDETDYCLNLTGFQAVVPSGWSRDGATGDCSNVPVNMCKGLVLSEIGANMSAQFIELHNNSGNPLAISNCKLQTNRSSAVFNLPDVTMKPREYLAVNILSTGLTLTKTTSGTVYLLSSDGSTEIQSIYYEDLDKDTSWAWFSGNDWRQTFMVTSGDSNTYQQYASCETGYIRNITTGRCNKIGSASMLIPCREGQYRSEETNRCRSIALTAASVLKPCGDDQFRNPLTNRCKKIASSDDLVDCGEGRERNPVTNRCRNVVQSDVPAAAFAVEPIKDSATAFVGWWALGGVATLGLGYAGWEWRREVTSALQKALAFFRTKA